MKKSALVWLPKSLITDESYKLSASDFWMQSCFFICSKKVIFKTCSLSKIMLTTVWSALSLSDLESTHVKLPFEDPTKLFFAIIPQSFLNLSVNSIFSNFSVHKAFATPKIEEIIAVKNLIFFESIVIIQMNGFCGNTVQWTTENLAFM